MVQMLRRTGGTTGRRSFRTSLYTPNVVSGPTRMTETRLLQKANSQLNAAAVVDAFVFASKRRLTELQAQVKLPEIFCGCLLRAPH